MLAVFFGASAGISTQVLQSVPQRSAVAGRGVPPPAYGIERTRLRPQRMLCVQAHRRAEPRRAKGGAPARREKLQRPYSVRQLLTAVWLRIARVNRPLFWRGSHALRVWLVRKGGAQRGGAPARRRAGALPIPCLLLRFAHDEQGSVGNAKPRVARWAGERA